ncbi:phosphotransacetylase family protein [Spirulina sp. 06S082]|uniref:phosphotransacetylase family protein n=1 Tax=Spirulina sp. 06S082 TaxID=3110248 RepID=UPI002B214221|nr:phosphotransacetylase family protein [Spirulina sp. 06S082]MEA5468632.1 phosphotransacetylase family protein [Spirulina sp. 06S082]
MPKTKCLLVGSTEVYGGKSATIIGIAHQLQKKGIAIGYGKPLGTYPSQSLDRNLTDASEEDVRFMAGALDLSERHRKAPILCLDELTIRKQLQNEQRQDNTKLLDTYVSNIAGDLILLEGPSTLSEGQLFDLSLNQMAEQLDSSVLLVARYHSLELLDRLLAAKISLGDRLLGVLISDIPEQDWQGVETEIQPFLERQNIEVFGRLPRNNLLRSVSVRELAKKLKAKILCREDRLDLMVETLTIGAMNVNSALEYFRKGKNMAVVTGGDRSELQLAALETSTNCLILTGHAPPQDFVLTRAEDLEIPILSVDLDTLTTVEIADRAFGQVRLQEAIKVDCIRDLMQQHFDIDRLMKALVLEPATVEV